MKHPTPAILAFAVLLSAAVSAHAQGRHDERPHGYDASVAKRQALERTKAVTPATGPRAHDNPLSRRKIVVVAQPEALPPPGREAPRN